VSAAIEVLSAGAAEEWYVGINGVPLGPVRLSTLRQKAQQGVIDEDSLVWREGFEEWLPLRTFPELVVLVREARETRETAGRASFTPAPPQAHGLSASPSRAPTGSPNAAAAAAEPEPRPGAAEEIEQEPATVIASSPDALAAIGQVTSDPFAPPPAPLPSAADLAIPGPGAVPDVELAVPERRSIVDDISGGVRRQVRLHPAAYVLIAIAFGFGVTGAIVFFTGDEPAPPIPTIKVVTVAAPENPAPSSTAAGATSVAMNAEDSQPEPRTGGGPRPVSKGTTTESGNDRDKDDNGSKPRRVGLGDGPSVAGPTVAGPGEGSSENLPEQLSQSDIERVVATHRASVKRGCWEPALRSRDRKAPKSAKVNVSVSVGPSGQVSSASASGGSGYPGLASCVASKVRRWQFPPSGSTSRANIPFAFFAQ